MLISCVYLWFVRNFRVWLQTLSASSSSGRVSLLWDTCVCWRSWDSSPDRLHALLAGLALQCWKRGPPSAVWSRDQEQRRRLWGPAPTGTCRTSASHSGSQSSSGGGPDPWSPSASASGPGAAARDPPGRTNSYTRTLCARQDPSSLSGGCFSWSSAPLRSGAAGTLMSCRAHNEQRALIGCFLWIGGWGRRRWTRSRLIFSCSRPPRARGSPLKQVNPVSFHSHYKHKLKKTEQKQQNTQQLKNVSIWYII